jgi:ketosteroid isomerase-like protein
MNNGDAETVLALSDPDVAIHGPRGTSHGRAVLRAWLAHAGARFETRVLYAAHGAVVAAQHGVWRDTQSGAVVGEADVATRFRVADGQVVELQRYDDLAAALEDASLSAADLCPFTSGSPAA